MSNNPISRELSMCSAEPIHAILIVCVCGMNTIMENKHRCNPKLMIKSSGNGI